MKNHLTINRIRKSASILVVIIFVVFLGFTSYLSVAYRNVLRDGVIVSADRRLLTDFDVSKFDRAIERLKKRRNLKGPMEGIRDPFGTIPE